MEKNESATGGSVPAASPLKKSLGSFPEQESAGGCFLKGAKARIRSVLVVGLLLSRARDPVLRLAGSGAQAVQSATVLGIIDVVFKEQLDREE